METIKANVAQVAEKHFIQIGTGEAQINIPLSEDKPIEVKSAFNKLISRIKVGMFKIELEAVGDDLFSQVANEYITQLNREIKEVHTELKQYGLIKE